MSWFTDPLCEAEILKEHCVIAYAVSLDFPSGFVRLTTWPGDLTISSNTFTGVGAMGSVSDVPENAQLTAERWTYTLSYVVPSMVPESEIDNCFGGAVVEYEVYLHPETHAVIGYEIRREGLMGRVSRRDGGETPVIQIDCETRLVVLEQTDGWLYTDEHQQDFFSGDTGCKHVRELDSIEIIWNGKRLNTIEGHLRGALSRSRSGG
jgi:hypothetical protein